MIHINFRFKKYIIKYIKKYILSLIIFCLIIISILIERKFCHNYKIVAISYANEKFLKQLKINKLTAINIGKVDEYYSYNFDDIDLIFKKQNEDILSRKRGNGYWLWKPYFILKTFKERLNIGDYLIYTDSGIFYLDKAKKLINFMISINEDMWSFKLKVLEKSFSIPFNTWQEFKYIKNQNLLKIL